MKEKQLPFFAEVIIDSDDKYLKKFQGKKGYILGVAGCETYFEYGVSVDDVIRRIEPEDLKPTGVIKKESDFYSGETTRVQVTEGGEGKIVED